MGGGEFEIGVPIDAVIDQKMPGQNLAKHALPFAPGAGDALQRLTAGIVDDVERHIQHLGDADCAVGGLGLDFRRTRQRVTFRPGNAAVDHFLLQGEDEIAIFRVHGADRAQFARPPEAVHQNLVVRHDGALVGYEMLETVDPMLLHQGFHIAMDGFVPRVTATWKE